MRILYGVQGTGNGHLSRARAMARAFATMPEVRVDWLFSGRDRGAYFDMDCFSPWNAARGLSFVARHGRVDYLRTAIGVRPGRFLRDVGELRIADYDAVVSDFEPVVAWAARRRGLPCVGIGHQYALRHVASRPERGAISRLALRHFAPVSTEIGLHWHSFGKPLMPPILDLPSQLRPDASGRVLVYLPFENQRRVIGMLRGMRGWAFDVFAPGLRERELGNVLTHPVGRDSFLRLLLSASHVVCNAGFELVSESLQLGKRVLVKPVLGQFEQESNAAVLQSLGYADTTRQIDAHILHAFLEHGSAPAPVRFPDVAGALAHWIVHREQPLTALSERLWSLSSVPCRARPAPRRITSALVTAGHHA